MAQGFEEDHAGGDGDVEGTNRASGGNGNEEVATLANKFVEARTFASHDDGDAALVIHIGVTFLGALVETNQPKTSFLELFHGTRQIFDASDGQMCERAGRNAGDGVRQTSGAPLGDDEASSACSESRANDGANVVRVFDAVEKNEQLIGGLGIALRMAGEKIFYVEGFARGGEGHDALVMFGGRGAVELDAILEAHRNPARARQVENFLYAAAVLPAGDEYAVERMPGDERFLDSMKSRQVVH